MSKRLVLTALAAAGSLALALLALDREPARTGAPPAKRAAEAVPAADRPDAVPPIADVEDRADALTLPSSGETRTLAAADARGPLELADGPWLDGRLVFPPDTPADERVFVVAEARDSEGDSEHRFEVLPNGAFRAAFPEGTRKGVLELEARYLYLEDPIELDLEGDAPELVLEPKLGGRIEGTLSLSIGDLRVDDLDGGKLELERTIRRGNGGFTVGTYRSAPIRGPAFAFDALPLGAEYEVKLAADFGYGRQIGDASIAAGRTSSIAIEVRPGIAIEGRVLDGHGDPVAKADVQANSEDPGSGTFGWGRAATARDGAYAIRGLPPGTLTVEVEADGFAPAKRELPPAAEGETLRGIELVLERGLEITGHVRWPDGSPAAGAAIDVDRREPGRHWYRESLVAAADGSFAVRGLAAGPYDLRASCPLGEPREVVVTSSLTGKEHTVQEQASWRAVAEDVAAGTSGLELLLDPGAFVAGSARDDLGRSLDAFEVEALPVDGSFRRQHFNPYFRRDGVRGSFVGSGGRFELGGLTPGTWSIAAKSEGHAASEALQVRVPGGASQGIELVVPRAGRIEGLVVDSGRGIGHAQVRIEDPGMPFGRDEDATTTDDAGRFALAEVAPGRVILQAISEQAAPSEPLAVEVAPGELVTGVVLNLRRGGRITGQVVDAQGVGLPGREVRLFGVSMRETTTDASGRFALENLPAGRHFLSSGPTPEEVTRYGASGSQNVHVLDRMAVVVLAELEHLEVTLAPPAVRPVRIHGRVTLSGRPFPSAEVFADCDTGFTEVETDEHGAYELTLPAPGVYGIRVSSRRSGLQCAVEVDVPSVDRFAFDIELEVGTIIGSVLDPEDRPLAGIQVVANLVEGEGVGEVRTGPDGSFRLEVPAGTHDVAAGIRNPWIEVPGSFAPARVRGIAVAPGAAVEGIVIRLSPGGSVEGTVEREDGGPPGQVWVVAVDGEGENVGSAPTDAAGAFRMEGVPTGRVRIHAFDPPERLTPTTALEVRAEETTRVALRLTKGTHVCARVVDGTGAALEVEAVELLDPDGEVIAEGSRDEEGLYQLGFLPSGTHLVRARHLGKTCERRVDLAGGGELTVELLIE
jgi:hypothetical protein